jgi:Tfp pilus assembly protein PilF
MIDQFSSFQVGIRNGRLREAFISSAALAAFLVIAATATAQVKQKDLIGDAVSETGARYADVDEAIKRFTLNDVLGARTFLENAKRKDASLPPVDLLLAKLYFFANNVAAGRASLEKTALENPEDPEAYLILGEQALQQRRTIEADALFNRALELTAKFNANPKRKRKFEVTARGGRAAVAELRKDWIAATNDLRELLKLDPENANAHSRLGRALFMQEKFREGYDEFVAGRKIDKKLFDPYVSAALMYDQLGKNNEAQQAFDRAIAANKTDPNTLTAYAQWLIKTGSLEKAETVLAEARRANPGTLNLLILSGVAARMTKKMKPAEDYFVEALGIAPANGDVINQLALLLIEQNEQAKRERALQFAHMSTRLNAESADAYITLAWVLFQLGRAGEADEALRRGLQFGNPSPDSSYLIAKMLSESKPDAAKQILRNALDAENPGIFIYRKDAQALHDGLKG